MALSLFRRHEPWLPGALLIVLAMFAPRLERSMAGHMAIELPALFAIGWLAARTIAPRLGQAFSSWNLAGIPALLATSLVLGFWMLPVSLDAAVLDSRMGIVKVASMLGAGFATGYCWRRIGLVVQAFFLFNWCWMNLTAGMLYQDAPLQLCSVYLVDQQDAAGRALVAWAVAVLCLWLVCAWRQRA